MSEAGPGTAIRIRFRTTARLMDERHRAASPLELLFDLTIVVAIAAATAQLAHSIADGYAVDGLLPFLQVFFAIWWAWMNFTWFASSYDTDDVAYRLLTMLQMAGVLVLAAATPSAAEQSDYRVVTRGYIIMRIGLVAQWLRTTGGTAWARLDLPGHSRNLWRYRAAMRSDEPPVPSDT